MRQVHVEIRLDPRAALAPTMALILATTAACATSGGVSTPTAATPIVAPSPSRPSATPSIQPEESAMATSPSPSTTATFTLTSRAFAEGEAIPREYTCHGRDVSPALAWQGVPSGAAALVLFVDDPDGHDWVHWSVLDLAPTETGLPKGVDPAADPPQQGRNDFRKVGYGGPCPPSGTHHYRFTLYALGAPLGLSGHPAGDAVRRALAGANVLGRVRLTGTFHA